MKPNTMFPEWESNTVCIVDDRILIIFVILESEPEETLPIRLLTHVTNAYEKFLPEGWIYTNKPVEIPRPEFFVLYYSKEDFPHETTLSLFDSNGKVLLIYKGLI